jgi:glutamate--cysteine ligase
MSLDSKQTEDRPITDPAELIEFFRSAERSGPMLVGLEHEKLIMPVGGSAAVPYEGPSGIGALMMGFAKFGWHEFREREGAPVIAMQRGTATLSLEPGGQFELSGAPFRTAREAHAENVQHISELHQVASSLGLRAVALGYRPFQTLAHMPWMPKSRYQMMRDSLGARGPMAHHMMLMTATGQVSLDWRDEADCARKVMASARISPLLVALYANSPVVEGALSGYESFRSHVWNEVDPARCGYPTSMLDGTFSYASYVEWAMQAPLLFLRRNGQYLRPAITFGQLLKSGYDGKPAQYADWVDHLSTLFPEVRIKKVLEIRAADCNGAAMTGALAALMRGLLYDATALGEVLNMMPPVSPAEHRALHAATQKQGLAARVGAGTAADYARELVEIATRGLQRLDPLDVPLLAPLAEIASTGRSPSTRVAEQFTRQPDPAQFVTSFEL